MRSRIFAWVVLFAPCLAIRGPSPARADGDHDDRDKDHGHGGLTSALVPNALARWNGTAFVPSAISDDGKPHTVIVHGEDRENDPDWTLFPDPTQPHNGLHNSVTAGGAYEMDAQALSGLTIVTHSPTPPQPFSPPGPHQFNFREDGSFEHLSSPGLGAVFMPLTNGVQSIYRIDAQTTDGFTISTHCTQGENRYKFHNNGDLEIVNGDVITSNGPLKNAIDALFFAIGQVQAQIPGSSDARLKKNVSPIEGALAKALSLRGVRFDFRADEFPERHLPATRQMGFIAQEVEKIAPEVVATDAKGYKTLAYGNMTALLVEALREEHARVEALEARLAALEGRKVAAAK